MTVVTSASAAQPMTAAAKKRAGARMAMRRGYPQQVDLFGGELHGSAPDVPAWRELPWETRAALTSLMAQLILDPAQASSARSTTEVGHDL